MLKPRIKRGMILQKQFPAVLVPGWHCASLQCYGCGSTPESAYEDWYQQRAAITSIEWMGKLGYGYSSPMHGGYASANQP